MGPTVRAEDRAAAERGAPSAALTMGVEEEFLLVDPATGATVARAGPVLRRARASRGVAAARFSAELTAAQVESVTGVHTSLDALCAELADGRARLAAAAAAEGALPIATGTPVAPAPDAPFTEGERFTAIADLYEQVVRGYESCGCHVHVGVPDLDHAVAVTDHLRPWLPTLLAVSANSPSDRGRDTGYQSWRMLEQARFPGSGVPPRFGSAAAYRARLERLVECGVLVDEAMTFWLARPSSRFPTVEVRAADTAAAPADAVLQAALTRALVRTALDDLAAGREAPAADDQVCAAAVWSAARYGLAGPAVHPVREQRVPARDLLDELLDHVRDALEDAGDDAAVRTLVGRLDREGTGADRQRRAAARGLPALLDTIAAHPLQGGDP
ncbi:carboxylate-amine ligase [Actinomadura parmotrematis]|uniref:Putative glutamate--cysteine ligase 2 n=1 Tax=Actinomadura parmotrematis TaxID=2864039 RepID=A0ABS7FT83_9ACTN|nr:glutamate--cysteine ligase [Actinomadura parmotrematis]MBW8483613.1 glutamate--cysteine ligase [Actinomadura parmotrematis]